MRLKRTWFLITVLALVIIAPGLSWAAGANMLYPRFRAWDDSNDPLAGGKLYTYYVGTSTTKYAYQDADLTTPHPAYITLDSNGEADIYGAGP